jgi:hypothetical protein
LTSGDETLPAAMRTPGVVSSSTKLGFRVEPSGEEAESQPLQYDCLWFGDWNQALDLSLSSTPRPKAHYGGRTIERPYTSCDSFAANEARLLLSLVAANLMHTGAALLERNVTARMSRDRFRQLILKSAARVLLTGLRGASRKCDSQDARGAAAASERPNKNLDAEPMFTQTCGRISHRSGATRRTA